MHHSKLYTAAQTLKRASEVKGVSVISTDVQPFIQMCLAGTPKVAASSIDLAASGWRDALCEPTPSPAHQVDSQKG